MKKLIRNVMRAAMVALTTIAAAACHHVDNDRIPPYPVYIPFTSAGEWELYGVAGATDSRSFIKQDRVPAGYTYAAICETGYGGVLLVSDLMGDARAYDLSCPVEVRPHIRIHVDKDKNIAVCNTCGSTYDIFSNYGNPLSGPAAERGYGLAVYHVSAPNHANIPYRIITR